MEARRIKNIIRMLFPIGAMIGALFGFAGTWNLPFAWACLGVFVAFAVVIVSKIDPSLRAERLNPAPGGKDRHLRRAMLPFILGCWIVAGLDVGRFHWSDPVPFGWRVAGLIGLAAALGLAFWAMMANRFFSPVVRIQQERGHHLITAGPYQYLRHPGYLGTIGGQLFGTLALGSWWALLPALGIVFLIVRRTALEDQFLYRELEGYTAYAERVRYRLLPGVW